MVDTCINTLYQIAKENNHIIVMGSDSMNIGEKFCDISEQYMEMGIAEANLVGAAAGISDCGIIPFVYAVAPFLIYRANEFIRDDICLQKRNVKIIAYSAGMDYCTSGPTHHTTEDIAMLRVLPNLTILSPASARDVEKMVRAAEKIQGPVYIRLGRERNREILPDNYRFQIGKALYLHEGNDVTIISTGTITYEALITAEKAEQMNIKVRVLHMGTLKPFDTAAVIKAAKETNNIITLEEHSIIGGLGGNVAEVLADNGLGVRFIRMGLKDNFAVGYGSHDEIKLQNKLGMEQILNAVIKLYDEKRGK